LGKSFIWATTLSPSHYSLFVSDALDTLLDGIYKALEEEVC